MKNTKQPPKKKKPLETIGWREWVGLADLGIKQVKTKVDTGATTSAIHATDISFYESHGKKRVKFRVSPLQRTDKGQRWATAVLEDTRTVKSSVGISTHRPMITTQLTIGGKSFDIKLTLINRDVMGFRMLLGREALKNRFLVHPGRSFLIGKKKRKRAKK